MSVGKFITIEGIEGVGKTTVKQVLCDCLKNANIAYELTREPGGTPLAESIRQLLLEKHSEPLLPLTEALLFFAGRYQNITQMIKPALQKGTWVISDRFVDSSLAYQGGGRGVPKEQLAQLSLWVCDDLKPDLTILLDAPANVGLDRIKSREKDRIEDESEAFFERVRTVYLDLAAAHPTRYRIVQADQPIEKVILDVTDVIEEAIQRT